MLLKTLRAIVENNFTPFKQDSAKATYAPKISTGDCKIDWLKTADTIHNQIRAFSPKPGAFTFYKNKRVKLFGSKVLLNTGSISLIRGQIDYTDSIFKIGTGTDPIQISNIQIEGKKMLPVNQFIIGFPRIIGGCFH